MTELENKKRIAALMAVNFYLEQEKQEAMAQTQRRQQPRYSSPWAQHGRSSIMQMRSLVQRRFIKR